VTQENSAEFYDNFNAAQAQTGINERIIGLYLRILKLGFKPDSVNLELGCGPGKLTYLLSKKLKTGALEATDISPGSVEIARSHIKHPNISFHVSDALEYKPEHSAFDNIFLFDVLEHIPEHKHPVLFKNISQWMHETSRLLINIPNPNYIHYAQSHRPESLQEIDQAIFLNTLSGAIYNAGLEIIFFETYSIWAEYDYQFLAVKKNTGFSEKLLTEKRNLFQKVGMRVLREYRKLRYRYPATGQNKF
jgi:cyclopropane fatty-acyl-phospholipid synthase-like methyltransferase